MSTRRIDGRYADAYHAAGHAVADSGRVIVPARPLHPQTRAPGFSQLPEPRGKHVNIAPIARVLPRHAPTFADVPARARGLYVASPNGRGYVRSAAGDALADYRAARAADPHGTPTVARCTLTTHDWRTLVSIAEAGPERQAFLAAKSSGLITIQD